MKMMMRKAVARFVFIIVLYGFNRFFAVFLFCAVYFMQEEDDD